MKSAGSTGRENFNEERNIQGFGRGDDAERAGDDTPWSNARDAAIERNYEANGRGDGSNADTQGMNDQQLENNQ